MKVNNNVIHSEWTHKDKNEIQMKMENFKSQRICNNGQQWTILQLCIASFMHVHVFFEQIFEGYASNKWISATIAHHRQSSSTHHSNDVVRSCFSSVENGNLQQKNKSIVGNIPRRWQLTFYESIIGNSTRHSTDNWPLPFGFGHSCAHGSVWEDR